MFAIQSSLYQPGTFKITIQSNNICIKSFFVSLFIFDFKSMNFQTNNQLPLKDNYKLPPAHSPSIRFKTQSCANNEDGHSVKRFQRSQSRKPDGPTTHNTSLTQRPPQPSAEILRNQPSIRVLRSEKSKKSLSLMQEAKVENSMYTKSKFIPNTMKCIQTKDVFLIQDEIKSAKLIEQHSETDTSVISKASSPKNSTFPFKIILDEHTKSNPYLRGDDKEKIMDKSVFNFKLPQSPQFAKQKQHFYRNFSTYLYNDQSQIANFSTEQSIIEHKPVKKVSYGCQTENKRITSTLSNTDILKTFSIKSQTQQTNKTYQKYIGQLNHRIENLEKQNRQVKQQLTIIVKQKQNLTKMVKQYEVNAFRKNTPNFQPIIMRNQNNGSFRQTSKEMALQMSVENLKKEIQTLRMGCGVKKLQEIIENIKKQNATLANQLQSVSLRCRVLEQQNNIASSCEQQNRKLKMEIKYFRGNIKQYKQQNQRLKNENQKLRNQINTGFQCSLVNSRMGQVWGSQTDSLNLSISILRD